MRPGRSRFSPRDQPGATTSALSAEAAALDNLSNAEFDVLAASRPELRKQIDQFKRLRAYRLQQNAKLKGKLAAADPEHFIWHVLGWRPTPAAKSHGISKPTTPDQTRVLCSLRDNKRTAVPAGQAVGKTKIAAAAVLWWLNRWDDSIVITTAGTWTQVEMQLWRELRTAFVSSVIPLAGKLMQTELRISDKHYATGISTDDVSRFQGFHAGHVLVVIDEATGVREEIWEGAEAITVGRDDRLLALGNPTDPASRFARVCESPLWTVVSIDCRKHPNVLYNDPAIIPGAVAKEWIDDKFEECAGIEDHPLYQARVVGRFPKKGTDTLIDLADVQRAQTWDEMHPRANEELAGSPAITHQGKGVALGLDIAGPGSDLCCCWSICDGRAKLEWWTIHTELMETVGKVVRTVRDYGGRVKALCLDDNGIGGGVGSRLLELQRWERQQLLAPSSSPGHLAACTLIRAVSGHTPHNEEKFWRLKDEAWWELAEALRKGILGLPHEAELTSYSLPRGNSLVVQLTTPIYELQSNGKIRVYDRRDPTSDKQRLRGLPTKSPDLAHSLMLARRAWKMQQAQWDEASPKSIHEAITLRMKQGMKLARQKFFGSGKEEVGVQDYEYLS